VLEVADTGLGGLPDLSEVGGQSIRLVIPGGTRELRAVVDFDAWVGKLRHRHKIVVYGDQELTLERDASMRRII